MTEINFSKGNGLIPVIIQEQETNEVLMLGYMNQAAFDLTRSTGMVHFFSRSKNRLWMKGETSGNTLHVQNIHLDCDGDTLLITATLDGTSVCHTGKKSCFYTQLPEEKL